MSLSESKPKSHKFLAKLVWSCCTLTGAFYSEKSYWCCVGKSMFTSIFLLRTETVCISVWEQHVVQHHHLSICHHTPVSAWCMLEIQAQKDFRQLINSASINGRFGGWRAQKSFRLLFKNGFPSAFNSIPIASFWTLAEQQACLSHCF